MNLLTLLAQADPIGKITRPSFLPDDAVSADGQLTGVMVFINNILRLVFIVAGIWAFFNLVLAGFKFLSAGGDPKAVAAAWESIWKSAIGLIIIVSSFLFAAILGMILFDDPGAILNPTLGT